MSVFLFVCQYIFLLVYLYLCLLVSSLFVKYFAPMDSLSLLLREAANKIGPFLVARLLRPYPSHLSGRATKKRPIFLRLPLLPYFVSMICEHFSFVLVSASLHYCQHFAKCLEEINISVSLHNIISQFL